MGSVEEYKKKLLYRLARDTSFVKNTQTHPCNQQMS